MAATLRNIFISCTSIVSSGSRGACRFSCSSFHQSYKVCIIGSGPAAFYTAQELLKVSLCTVPDL